MTYPAAEEIARTIPVSAYSANNKTTFELYGTVEIVLDMNKAFELLREALAASPYGNPRHPLYNYRYASVRNPEMVEYFEDFFESTFESAWR